VLPLSDDDDAAFAAVRAAFPSLQGRTCMVTHSFGPCPAATFDDLDAYRDSLRRRPHQLGAWFERLEEMYGLVERLLGAPAGSVALRESTSGCHASMLAALDAPRPGDAGRRRIVASALQFPSIGYMVAAQARRGFVIDVVDAPDGQLDAHRLAARLDDDVACVTAPVVASNRGALLDVRPLLEAAEATGTIAILDATAAVGLVPLDLSELPPCVLVGGTVKWLGGGGTGLAFLYIHPTLLDRLPVAYPGWLGDARFTAFAPDFLPAAGARRHQQGTPAIEPVYTARAGIRFALEQGVPRLFARNRRLLDRLHARAIERGLPLHSPRDPQRRAGTLALELDDAPALVEALAAHDIDVDARGDRILRIGPHACVTSDECDRTIDRIAVALEDGNLRASRSNGQ
jgi:kynureninase